MEASSASRGTSGNSGARRGLQPAPHVSRAVSRGSSSRRAHENTQPVDVRARYGATRTPAPPAPTPLRRPVTFRSCLEMSVCETARILPACHGHSATRSVSQGPSSSPARLRKRFPTSSDQLPSSLSTILAHREASLGAAGRRAALRPYAGFAAHPPASALSPRRPSERRRARGAVNCCFGGRREAMLVGPTQPRRPFVPSSRSGAAAEGGGRAERLPGASPQTPPPPQRTHKQRRPPPSPPPPLPALPSPSHLPPPALSPAPRRLHTAPGSRERAASPPPPATAAAPGAAPPPRAGAHTPQPAPAAPSLAPIGSSAPGGRS